MGGSTESTRNPSGWCGQGRGSSVWRAGVVARGQLLLCLSVPVNEFAGSQGGELTTKGCERTFWDDGLFCVLIMG